MKEYREPILSTIFTVLGGLVLIGSVIWLIICVFGASEARSSLPLLPAIGVAVALVLSALIYFGLAQTIDYLGRTAHSTDRLCTLVQTSLTQQGEHSATITDLLSKSTKATDRMWNTLDDIDTLLREAGLPKPLGEASTQSAPPAKAQLRFYVSEANEATGPFSVSEIQQRLQQGVLSSETLILREGTKNWMPLSQTGSFNV